jgi:hypothetical protein
VGVDVLAGPVAGRVLVLGDDGELGELIRLVLGPTYRVRTSRTAAETEGVGVDVVVVSGSHPLEELTEVRVHPRLFDLPVVLVAPGRKLSAAEWRAEHVWVITRRDPGVIDAVVDNVARLAARARHPSARGAMVYPAA